MIRLFTMLLLVLIGLSSCQSNTMTLDELLFKQRKQYLASYKLGLAQNKTAKSAVEVMLQVTATQNRHLPELFQVNRVDLLNVDKEGKFNITEINLDKDSLLNYDKHVFDVDGMAVEITPFVWNGCELTLDQKPDITYESWIRKWIDIKDLQPVAADGFQHVIHNVTYPVQEGGKWTTSIDFGSAPTEAFTELMSVLSKQGIKKVEVHSRSFTQ